MSTRILIIDDDEVACEFLQEALLRAGYEVDAYMSAKEALGEDLSHYDLLISDIRMPEIDGLEATRQIKLINPNIPVIAITAYAMSGDEERVKAAGCDGYLSKPVSKDILLKMMAELAKV